MSAEEHVARLNAEGQAADSNRRLQVAQEQVAEFAQQREEEAAKLLEQVNNALGRLGSSIDPPGLAVLEVKQPYILLQLYALLTCRTLLVWQVAHAGSA